MYQPISSHSYNGLGQFWGEASKVVDPSTVIPQKSKRLSASEGGQLLYRAKALRHYQNKSAHGVSDDIYWTPAGPLWSMKPVSSAKKAEVVIAPIVEKKIETKIVRDAPTLNLPPVGLSGLDGMSATSLKMLAIGLASFAVAWLY